MDSEHLINSIDHLYFQDHKEFNLNHLTEQLPENLVSDQLVDFKNRLEKNLNVVTKKVSELVLSHQPAYISELQRIADLQKSITESIRVCSQGRRCLRFIKDGTAKNGSTIAKHYQRRESLCKLLDSLNVVNNLYKSVIEIRTLIDSQKDFPSAIQMCKDGKAILAPFNQYNSINDLVTNLNNTIERLTNQALSFFNAFHNSSIEELKMFLENENWEIVPVRSDFKLVQLKEFSFLRSSDNLLRLQNETVFEHLFAPEVFTENEADSNATDINIPIKKVLLADKDSRDDLLFVSEDHQGSSYFDQPDALPLDRISLSSDSDLDSDLEKEFVDEDDMVPKTASPKLIKFSGPILTNTSLNVLRLAGRYVQMMNVLSPISFEILMKIYKLLDHYTEFVFRKFGPNNDDKELNAVIKSLRESLIGSQASTLGETNVLLSQTKIGEPINSKKAIAIESLIFLVNQFWNLQEYLETLITAEQRAKLRDEFSQNDSIVPDFLKARAELESS